VRRINSSGVREWVNFIRDLSTTAEITLSHCRPVIVAQLNMIFNFGGKARVTSFYAPYACSRCDREEEMLVSLEAHFAGRDFALMPEFRCSGCGGSMQFDEVAERYLVFLRDQKRTSNGAT